MGLDHLKRKPPVQVTKDMPPAEKKAARQARKAAGPKLKHKCGHETALSHWESQDCGQCRNKRRMEKVAKEKAAKEARKAARQPELQFRFPNYAQIITRSNFIDGEWYCEACLILDQQRFDTAKKGSGLERAVVKECFRELKRLYLESQTLTNNQLQEGQ